MKQAAVCLYSLHIRQFAVTAFLFCVYTAPCTVGLLSFLGLQAGPQYQLLLFIVCTHLGLFFSLLTGGLGHVQHVVNLGGIPKGA